MGILRIIAFSFFIWGLSHICLSQTISVAHQSDFYPFCWEDSTGQSQGLLIDLWTLIGTKIDKEITFKAGSNEECIEWLNNGTTDAIAGMFMEETSNGSVQYGDPFMKMSTSLFLKKNIKPKSIYEIEDEIGITSNSISKDYIIQQFPDLPIEIYPTTEELASQLTDRNLAGFFYERPNPIVEIKNSYIPSGYYKYLDIKEDNIRPVFKKGNLKIMQDIQTGLNQISNEESFIIAKKYNFQKKTNDLPWYIAGSAVLLLLLFFYLIKSRLRKLKTQPLGTQANQDWAVLIDKGENDRIEFKSSLRYDYRQEKCNKALEQVIAKTISAFLNTDGGILFIGVADDGNVVGLEKDYTCMSRQGRDGYLLILTNLVNKYFGKKANLNISSNIISLNEKDVCVIEISKSERPVFIKFGEKEEFYVRASAASLPLSMREATEYVKTRF